MLQLTFVKEIVQWLVGLNTAAKQLMAALLIVISILGFVCMHLYLQLGDERKEHVAELKTKDGLIFKLIADKEKLSEQVKTAKVEGKDEMLSLFKGLLEESKEETRKQEEINRKQLESINQNRRYLKSISKTSDQINNVIVEK